ncbi:MAG: hypothetical protein IH598_17345 [Bacteroidales bacterium]|nr:hypothetical protein [Bacteroidales bacterium]
MKKHRQVTILRLISIVFLFCSPIFVAAQPDYVESNSVYTGQAEIAARERVTLKPGFVATSGSSVRVFTDPNLNLPQINYEPESGYVTIGSNPSSNKNYIRTTTLRAPTTNPSQINQTPHTQEIAYFDGLGRPLQTVIPKGSPQMKDLVTPVSFDQFGREDKKYLTYVSEFSSGEYNPYAYAECINYYQGEIPGREPDNEPYSTIHYDNSPLNRITGETGPGENWIGHPTAINYKTNTAAVKHWRPVNGAFVPFNYPLASLYINETVDEDGNVQRTFTDKMGQTVRTESAGNSGVIHRTAYIYDDFGLLRCVVPPKVSDSEGPSITELCYYYKYDARKRLIEKRLPGAEWIYYVYDKRDRMALWQDGVMRLQNKWHYNLYDAHNRQIISGITTITGINLEDIRYFFENFGGNLYESWTPDGELYGYSNSSTPFFLVPTLNNIQTATWYDNYDFLQLFAGYEFPTVPPNQGFSDDYLTNVRGMATGSLERVDGIAGVNLVTVNYFDNRLRVICTVKDNHLGGRNNTFYAYNFSDQVVTEAVMHNASASPNEIVLITNYTYDHQGRMLGEKLKMNDHPQVTTKAYEYNELGDLVNTYMHGSATGQSFNQKVKNKYNIRGWLRMINNPDNLDYDLFGLELRYEAQTGSGAIGVAARYNGNIAQMRWNSKSDMQRGYGFEYDKLNRLTASKYAQGSNYTSNSGYFNTQYVYDPNGNFTRLTRFHENTKIDDLIYSYHNTASRSNRLSMVYDITGNPQGYIHGSSGNYLYDANANMTHDPSKMINVAYNHLNLPSQITFGPDDNIQYAYTATGAKLRKTVTTMKTTSASITDYCGNFIYSDNQLITIFAGEVRVAPVNAGNSTFWKYEYSMKDHLGNTRVVFAAHSHGQPELLQQTSYYPFGMTLQQQNYYSQNTTENKYLYNSKELQDEQLAGNRLDWYDYGARFYGPDGSRFFTIDPLTEKFPWQSPYCYAGNNPIRFIDYNGLGPGDRVKAARSLTGIEYKQEKVCSMRTANTAEAKQYMDCAEFVCRVLGADQITDGVQHMNSSSLKSYFDNKDQFILSSDPQVGDIAVWNGHVGVVTVVGEDGKIKLAHARGEKKLSIENPEAISPEKYRKSEFYGYYRPVTETPDGKIDNNGNPVSTNNQSDNSTGSFNLTLQPESAVQDKKRVVNNSFIQQIKNLPQGNYKVVNGQIVPQ